MGLFFVFFATGSWAAERANYCVAVNWDRANGRANPYVADDNVVCRNNVKGEKGVVLKERGNWRLVQFKDNGDGAGCQGDRTYWLYQSSLRETGEATSECRRPGGTEAASCGPNCNNPTGVDALVEKVESVAENLVDRFRSNLGPNEYQQEHLTPQERRRYESGLDAQLSSYPAKDWVKDMIVGARANAKLCLEDSCTRGRSKRVRGKQPETVPTGFCYRYVKYAMVAAGLVDSKAQWPAKTYRERVYGSAAGVPLQRLGFKNIIGEGINASNAPKGAILVYSGGEYGHIEIKTGDNEYISDFISRRPASAGGKRRLIGVYIKP